MVIPELDLEITITRDQIEAVKAAYPWLGDRGNLLRETVGIQVAYNWLAPVEKTTKVNWRFGSCGVLKHLFEDATGLYVTRDTFAAGAILAGFKPSSKPMRHVLNISKRSLDKRLAEMVYVQYRPLGRSIDIARDYRYLIHRQAESVAN